MGGLSTKKQTSYMILINTLYVPMREVDNTHQTKVSPTPGGYVRYTRPHLCIGQVSNSGGQLLVGGDEVNTFLT